MDLSNLSNTLPTSKPLIRKPETSEQSGSDDPCSQSRTSSQSSISDLNTDLTTHFKGAAKAVASLYNSSINPQPGSVVNAAQKHAIKTDFANAARAVAALFKSGQVAHSTSLDMGYLQCLDDLLQVITNDEDVENWALTRRAEITNANHPSSLDEAKIPQDFVFSFESDMKPPTAFRPSIPPMSVQHNASQRNAMIKKKKLQHLHKKFYSSEESSESETDDLKRAKLFKEHSTSPLKKKKRRSSKE
ncbi:hypothetical protein CANMA_001332 [Candida margitis]|uniref:uncharacterized protein n=1 Tax=Candida margitis TaxID=1775924 RepID=UPI002226E4E9|nr:uncharacterized protein CANMA_001332 [Candida margitis]KAI5969669.1 hypothetical protein CANMA_001332 [Candida margitis]